MSLKPNDFFIGLQDFFTILVPGGVFVIFLYFNMDAVTKDLFNILFKDEKFYNFQFPILLFYSYIFGHVLKRIGRILDIIYDKFFSLKGSDLVEEIKKHKKEKFKLLSNYEWARFTLLESNSSYANEVERDMVSSKFFRTLVICIIPILIFFIIKGKLLVDIGLILLLTFSFYQYIHLRKNSVEKTYKYAIYNIHQTKVKNRE
ncbi:hypothetical protein [uncultured Kordia sp.]|uniref:hypothetical protein n=1 Tax=uncultured Kordia sp. TaxID=507699 RepID=UPI00262F26BE|nr:hypothetical protein [uncultured Kordia sp.]